VIPMKRQGPLGVAPSNPKLSCGPVRQSAWGSRYHPECPRCYPRSSEHRLSSDPPEHANLTDPSIVTLLTNIITEGGSSSPARHGLALCRRPPGRVWPTLQDK
jgi:hypothetical protein